MRKALKMRNEKENILNEYLTSFEECSDEERIHNIGFLKTPTTSSKTLVNEHLLPTTSEYDASCRSPIRNVIEKFSNMTPRTKSTSPASVFSMWLEKTSKAFRLLLAFDSPPEFPKVAKITMESRLLEALMPNASSPSSQKPKKYLRRKVICPICGRQTASFYAHWRDSKHESLYPGKHLYYNKLAYEKNPRTDVDLPQGTSEKSVEECLKKLDNYASMHKKMQGSSRPENLKEFLKAKGFYSKSKDVIIEEFQEYWTSRYFNGHYENNDNNNVAGINVEKIHDTVKNGVKALRKLIRNCLPFSFMENIKKSCNFLYKTIPPFLTTIANVLRDSTIRTYTRPLRDFLIFVGENKISITWEDLKLNYSLDKLTKKVVELEKNLVKRKTMEKNFEDRRRKGLEEGDDDNNVCHYGYYMKNLRKLIS